MPLIVLKILQHNIRTKNNMKHEPITKGTTPVQLFTLKMCVL